MPVHSTSKNRVYFLDRFGQIFGQGYSASDLKLFVVDPEIVDVVIDHKELSIKAKKEGFTIIELSHPQMKAKDYIFVQVKGEVTP